MISLGNSGPLGKAIVTTMAKAWDNVVAGSKAIVDFGLAAGQKIVDFGLSAGQKVLEEGVDLYKSGVSIMEKAFTETMVSIGNSGPIGKAIVSTVSNITLSGIHTLQSYAQSLFGGCLPYSLEPPYTFKDIDYSKYSAYQGDTWYCADYSISMAYNIYYGSQGISNPACDVNLITKSLNSIPFGRFTDRGGTTPWAINKELNDLGIPFTFLPCATLEDIDRALAQGKIVMITIGEIKYPEPGTWGHVMLIVGKEGNYYKLLNPNSSEKGVTTISREELLSEWWHAPVHPCWIIG
jgi:hypothetical protein